MLSRVADFIRGGPKTPFIYKGELIDDAYVRRHRKDLTQVEIHESVLEVKTRAFFRCSALTVVNIPHTVTKLGDAVFRECISLESINIPNTVNEMGHSVFYDCHNLRDVTLAPTLTKIGKDIFRGCKKFKDIKRIGPSILDPGTGINIKDGPGPDTEQEFIGETQRGWGPKWWGISLEQIQNLRNHHLYSRTGTDFLNDFTMRELVNDELRSLSDGTGMGYALLINQQKPLRAKVMVTHSFDMSVYSFVESIERSEEKGPFWVSAFAMYQNHDSERGVDIVEEKEKTLETAPFTTVLKEAEKLVVLSTQECDIFTRLWCNYEIYVATKLGTQVKLVPNSGYEDTAGGYGLKMAVEGIKNRADSINTHCGVSEQPNSDEIAIRKAIEASPGGFSAVDEAVERLRLSYLLEYPMDKIKFNKNATRDNVKKAILDLIPCFPSNTELKTFHDYLSKKLSTNPGLVRIAMSYGTHNHSYWVMNENRSVKIDVYEEWIKTLLDALNAKPFGSRIVRGCR